MPWWVADMQRTVAWPGPRPRKVCKAMSLPHLGIRKVLAHADIHGTAILQECLGHGSIGIPWKLLEMPRIRPTSDLNQKLLGWPRNLRFHKPSRSC